MTPIFKIKAGCEGRLRMNHCLRSVFNVLLNVVCAALLLPALGLAQHTHKSNLDQIPKQVMDGLKSKFPNAKIDKWTKEDEGGFVVYDFEFKQEGRKYEADIKEDGTIHNWEKAIAFKDLPDAVQKTVQTKYPKSTPIEVMEITAIKNGKDELEGYEVIVKTAKKKVIEVTLAPDGRILEDSTDQK
jgi:putative PepSY-like beta-lactamase-inhibitor